jgi:DDE superfamily endonuclease
MYIDEQVYYLWDEFEVQVSEQAIQRMLKRVKWSKKKVSCVALFHPIFHRLSDF